MKVAIMSGAFVNSGDFLIEQRSRELIESILCCDVEILKRNLAYDDKLNELNKYDVIVFAGGPIFQPSMYPKRIPFVSNMQKIEVPIRILGGGWKGRSEKELYRNYAYTKDMMLFISSFSKQYSIGCRDWYTVRNLKRYGIDNLVMTGCPAWYDIGKIQNLKIKDIYSDIAIEDDIVIGISDPAIADNKPYFYELINIISKHYSCVKIRLFFHRGISGEDQKRLNKICQLNSAISFVDMSGTSDCFQEYNKCFMHIGFRVHAHIYNLSQGNISILINEDARGMGVNHALGIENINCLLNGFNRLKVKIDSYLFERIILDYINYIVQSDYAQYHRAFLQIKENFKVMEDFISKMI